MAITEKVQLSAVVVARRRCIVTAWPNAGAASQDVQRARHRRRVAERPEIMVPVLSMIYDLDS
jgi:hypothetical protein